MPSEESSPAFAANPAVEDAKNPASCPRCGWLGTRDQARHGLACPQCSTKVNPLRQKGLDSLRTHYRLLSKIGSTFASTLEQKDAERHRLEKFFQRIGAPL